MAEHEEGGGGVNMTGLWVIIGLVVLAAFLFGVQNLSNLSSQANPDNFFSKIVSVISFFTNPNLWFIVGIISAIFSILCISLMIFCLIRMREIQNHEKMEIAHEISIALARDAELEQNVNPRWKYVLGLVEGASESDWRVAIIESDSMLDELLQDKGYSGSSIGERLASAEGDAFSSYENAWEAHKVRNQIAHAGTEFTLTQLQARRTIRLYETVFEEFNII